MKKNKEIHYGIIHCHSEHSLKDGAMSVHELVSTAKNMNAPAVTLTDHGSCTGIVSFLKETKASGIKGIPGVEMYVRSNPKQHYASKNKEEQKELISYLKHQDVFLIPDNSQSFTSLLKTLRGSDFIPPDIKVSNHRSHLLLLAKNTEGYREISRAVTKANENIETAGSYRFPILMEEQLADYFGHGNVFATSACVSGPMANILLSNFFIQKEIDVREKKVSRILIEDGEKEALLRGKQDVLLKILELKQQEAELKKLAEYDFSMQEKTLSVLSGEAFQLEFSFLEEKKKATFEAKRKLPAIQDAIKEEDANLKSFIRELNKLQKKLDKKQELLADISFLKTLIQPEEVLYEQAKEKLLFYKKIFGSDFFIELQYHGLPIEKIVYPIMQRLSEETNTPVVCTNDAHISTPDKVPKREFLRSLQNNRFEAATSADKEMYIKSDEELKKSLCNILPEEVVDKGFQNIKWICDHCSEIDIFKEESLHKNMHYPVYIEDGKPCPDSPALLKKMAYDGIAKRFPAPSVFDEVYQKRLVRELDVIISMGYADYLLIVQDYVNYGKRYGQEHCPEKVAYTIGPGRGSAAGSLVCYLIGITCIDPIKHNLLFERFLNKDRVSMPDIDVDFAEEVRDACIDYVKEKYGVDSVSNIRTEMTQAARAAIRNAARILSDKYYKDTSVLLPLADRIAKEVPFGSKIRFSTVMDNGQTVREHLLETFKKEKHAKEVIELAVIGEGSITSLGVHAAGVLISDGPPISEYVPLLNNEKKGWAASYDMVECEDIGCLKMDFLGLKNLDILTDTLRRVYRNYNIRINLEDLPEDKEVFTNIFSTGNTDSVFQFESDGMKKLLRDFQPDCLEDIILLVAAYRPGPMEFLPKLIAVKQGKKEPSYIIPELEPILKPTYGQVIYQEQLMDIFHLCADFTLGEADIIRRYMSKKKVDKFLTYQDQFVEGIMHHGASRKNAEAFWDSLVDFSKYAFNKSHAAAYALISYQTAYLKYHYPVEYMCAVMTISSNDKLSSLCYNCRMMGIEIKNVDINHSMNRFLDYPEEKAIRFGFSGIKGMGNFGQTIEKERKENGPFVSIIDFIKRTSPSKSVMEPLVASGAFDSFFPNKRLALFDEIPYLIKLVASWRKKQLLIEEKTKIVPENAKKKKTILAQITKNKHELQDISFQMEHFYLNNAQEDDRIVALNREKEYLSAYVSGQPLDSYRYLYNEKTVMMAKDFSDGERTIVGMITEFRILKRKKDNAEFVVLNLEDPSGTIHVVISVKRLNACKPFCENGRVVRIIGSAMTDPETKEKTFFANSMSFCKSGVPYLLFEVKNINDFILNEAFGVHYKNNIDEFGRPVLVFEQSTGKIYSGFFKYVDGEKVEYPLKPVSEKIKENFDFPNIKIYDMMEF